MILHGDCLDRLKELPANSVDAVVTDPPYGLAFMGKRWDYDVPSVAIWTEALRVLKPGGHLLSFGGTRTYHRMVVNIEDAGFEIRDQIQWLYGSGFPKSLNVSKAIDKAGAERAIVGFDETKFRPNRDKYLLDGQAGGGGKLKSDNGATITAPATDAAKQWQGWGTALKPAFEPVCLARKPLEKGLTVAENVQKWGTGAINVDASRIGVEARTQLSDKGSNANCSGKFGPGEIKTVSGRWPANVLFDEEAAAVLDAQTQHLHGAGSKRSGSSNPRLTKHDPSSYTQERDTGVMHRFGDSGGASRFFYVAKATKRERGDGNGHPTVKPLKLMEYLIRMVTPPTGIVLDPFAGSGTTLVAAKRLGFGYIGIEREAEYVEIASKRLEAAAADAANDHNLRASLLLQGVEMLERGEKGGRE